MSVLALLDAASTYTLTDILLPLSLFFAPTISPKAGDTQIAKVLQRIILATNSICDMQRDKTLST